jgi:cyclophilin family peptidyl-prolyl cis-trans isomerase
LNAQEGTGLPYTLRGKYFYRIIDQFIDQTGVGTESALLTKSGMYDDDPEGLKLQHDRKGLLSVANLGHNTTTSHFR